MPLKMTQLFLISQKNNLKMIKNNNKNDQFKKFNSNIYKTSQD